VQPAEADRHVGEASSKTH